MFTVERLLRGGAANDANARYFDTSGVLHTRDEEESVFPRRTPGLARDDAGCHADLESQHRSHIAPENEQLIRPARSARTGGELAAIPAEMKRRRGLLTEP